MLGLFPRSDNFLVNVVYTQVCTAFLLFCIQVILILLGRTSYYSAIYHFLGLSSSWADFLARPWTLLTYFWINEYSLRTAWHLLLLYRFGTVLGYVFDKLMLSMLYITGGIVGGLAFLLLYNLSPGLQHTQAVLTHTTGAVYAVIVAAGQIAPGFMLWFPLLGRFRMRPAVIFLLLLTFLGLTGDCPGIHVSNLTGGLVGYVYVKCLGTVLRLRAFLVKLRSAIRSRLNRRMKTTVRHAPSVSTKTRVPTETKQEVVVDQANQSEVDPEVMDAILDKVAQSGYNSLTQAEKEQLFHAAK